MAFLLLGGVGLIWGISYPITAAALNGFDVLSLRVLIQALGGLAMLARILATHRNFAIEREAWPDLVVAAGLNMTVLPISFTIGVYLMGPGRTSVLVYTMPIWASLFARIALGERLTITRAAALVFGAGAVAGAAQRTTRRRGHSAGGDVLWPRHGVVKAPRVACGYRGRRVLAIGEGGPFRSW